MKKTRLDFIGIGVQKSATTWIARCLEEHPEVHFSKCPYGDNESNFFNYSKELHFFNNDVRYEKDYQWYHSKFEFGSWKSGEYSTLYFPNPKVSERIYRYNPDIKLLLSLRNPIDRAFSGYQFAVMGGLISPNQVSFRDALKDDPQLIKQGKYATHLERYLDFFDLNQIHIMFYDEIKLQPEKTLLELYEFLGINTSFKPSILNKKVNVSQSFRYPKINNLIKFTSRTIRSIAGDRVAEKIKATKVLAIIQKYNNLESNLSIKPSLSKDDRKYLYDIFFEEMERLKILLGRDIPGWI